MAGIRSRNRLVSKRRKVAVIGLRGGIGFTREREREEGGRKRGRGSIAHL